MSVIRFNKIFLSSFLLVFVLLFPLTAFAMVATPSDAVKVPVASSNEAETIQLDNVHVATSSDASPSQEYADLDSFDTVDMPVLTSSDDGDFYPLNATVTDYSSCQYILNYYDMNNVLKTAKGNLSSNGYFSIGCPSDCAKLYDIRIVIRGRALPPSGKYIFKLRFGSNTYVNWGMNGVALLREVNNSSGLGGSNFTYENTTSQLSGDFYISRTINLSGSNVIHCQFVLNSTAVSNLPIGGYVKVRFEPLGSSVTTQNSGPSDSSISTDLNYDVANNTAQQVEQGDTIIELIKNTIQTISSQLTAFWNQLAGEFTNLYGKMDVQHQESMGKVDEQIDNDNSNTDKVTTAIETHGNFIIEGLKKLFIPSDEYFKAYFDDLYSWFSERFGFLSFPIDLLLEVIDIFVNSSQTDCVLVLPSFTIMENLLWPEMSFNLTEFLNTNFSFVVVAIKTVTSIYLVMAFVQLCEEKWNEVMMN